MVRQVQSSSNAGTFTNGMPMTSSMGCGVWGGNITNENISLKHYMNVTWVSRPIPEDRPSEAGAVRRVLQLARSSDRSRGTTYEHRHPAPSAEPLPHDRSETRIAAYLLTDYLERLGVEVDLRPVRTHRHRRCSTRSARAASASSSTRHEQVAAHAADGYARATGQARRAADAPRSGPDQRRHRRRQRGARFDPDGRDRRRRASRTTTAAIRTRKSTCTRTPTSSRSTARSASASTASTRRAICRASSSARSTSAQTGRPGPGARRRADGRLLGRSCRRCVRQDAAGDCAGRRSTAATAARIVDDARRRASGPVLYAGGGVLSARASDGTRRAGRSARGAGRAHADGQRGACREDHPLLLGMTGFWGTPIANEKCRTADLILAVGTRLAEANSSSWDPRFTFDIPPTRLIHIDADVAEIGRNFPTELGVVADAKLALGGAGAGGARHRAGDRGALRAEIARGRQEFAANWADHYTLGPVPDAARADPERAAKGRPRGRLHRHRRRAGTRTASASSFRSPCPARSSRPSGLATMGFGPAAALGVKMAQPDRAVDRAHRRRRRSAPIHRWSRRPWRPASTWSGW